MKEKIIRDVCNSFKRAGTPQKRKNIHTGIDEAYGRIDFAVSVETLQAGVDVLSEDEVLRLIGKRIVELIMAKK